MTAPERAMTDVDKVAEAIWEVHYADQGGSWPDASEDQKANYRRMAVAAIDALGLTEETNAHFGDRYTDDEPATRRRLVAPWQNLS